MESNELPKQPPRFKFRPVSTNVTPGFSKLDPEGALMLPTGYIHLNVRGTNIWIAVCRAAGIDAIKAIARLMVDDETGVVAAYPALSTTAELLGVSPVNWFENRTCSMHLGGVLAENPHLKPAGKRKVQVSADTDEEGQPFMLINLALAATHQTIKRKKDETAAADEA